MSNNNPLETIGLSYSFIEKMPLDELRAYVKEQKTTIARMYHPDKKKSSPYHDEEKFKNLSGAIDDVCNSKDANLEEWRKQLYSHSESSEPNNSFSTSGINQNLNGANSSGLLSSLLFYLREAKVDHGWNRLGCDGPFTFRCPVIEKSTQIVEELIKVNSKDKEPGKTYSSVEEELADLVETLGGTYRR